MYFVMLDHPSGAIVPLTDENDEVAQFERIGEARMAAMNEPLGIQFGYKIYDEKDGV